MFHQNKAVTLKYHTGVNIYILLVLPPGSYGYIIFSEIQTPLTLSDKNIFMGFFLFQLLSFLDHIYIFSINIFRGPAMPIHLLFFFQMWTSMPKRSFIPYGTHFESAEWRNKIFQAKIFDRHNNTDKLKKNSSDFCPVGLELGKAIHQVKSSFSTCLALMVRSHPN